MSNPYTDPIPAPAPYDGPLEAIPAEAYPEDAVELEPTKPRPDEVYNSLNYFDELAVKRCFGEEILALKARPNAFMRSLVFSILRKEGLKDKEAQDRVFQMPNGEVTDYFLIEKRPPRCVDEMCPCAEHIDEDDEKDPTERLS